jgi:hypothetical protein
LVVHVDDWFLGVGERGNSDSAIDRRHDGVPWAEGNRAVVLVGQSPVASLNR